MKKLTSLMVTLSILSVNLYAYGPTGHTMVGEIAQKLIEGTPPASKLSVLLDGVTLGEVAILPDEIKGWYQTPPSDPDAFYLASHPQIEAQLVAFWDANNEV